MPIIWRDICKHKINSPSLFIRRAITYRNVNYKQSSLTGRLRIYLESKRIYSWGSLLCNPFQPVLVQEILPESGIEVPNHLLLRHQKPPCTACLQFTKGLWTRFSSSYVGFVASSVWTLMARWSVAFKAFCNVALRALEMDILGLCTPVTCNQLWRPDCAKRYVFPPLWNELHHCLEKTNSWQKPHWCM